MKRLSTQDLEYLARKYDDDRIVSRFRTYRFTDSPPTFMSADASHSVLLGEDGKWRFKMRHKTHKDKSYGSPVSALQGMWSYVSRNSGKRRALR